MSVLITGALLFADAPRSLGLRNIAQPQPARHRRQRNHSRFRRAESDRPDVTHAADNLARGYRAFGSVTPEQEVKLLRSPTRRRCASYGAARNHL